MESLLLITLLPAVVMVGCNKQVPSSPGNPAPTSTPTLVNTPTSTSTATKTATAVSTATSTPTVTKTATAVSTVTSTPTVTSTHTTTSTPSDTLTKTPTATATATATSSGLTGPAVVPLGSAANYVVLSYNSITNSGATTVCSGLVGEFPGSSVTGYNSPAGTYMECNGTDIAPDFSATAGTAENDLTTAYNNAMGRTATTLASPELGGSTLVPGVYSSTPSLDVTGNLTLDGTGYTNGGVFIFQTAGVLTTAASSQVILAGGAQAANIFWQVGNYASLGATSIFFGNIMSATYVALDSGAVLDGRAFSQTSYVSLLSNTVTLY